MTRLVELAGFLVRGGFSSNGDGILGWGPPTARLIAIGASRCEWRRATVPMERFMLRNLVVCCDGTTNEIAGDSTNVLRTYRCLVRNPEQIAYYDCGVATISHPDRITERGRWLSRMVDAGLGLTVRAHAINAYLFLVRHYQPGDRVFLFGFSRGAYTVRAVAGMIHFLGLLHPELENLAELAWSVYSGEIADKSVRRRFHGGNRFRRSFAVDVPVTIHFVGVWDTVSSFGWLGDLRTLPHTANNPSIAHIRHALAIDERRAMFQANHFRPQQERQHETFKEVWFAGFHGDVGGGHPESDGTISKVSLEWMHREAEALGLIIDDRKRRHLLNEPPDHPPANSLGTVHESLRGLWHLAELLPLRSYSGDARKKRWKFPHLWRHRTIKTMDPGGTKPILHGSVLERVMARPGYRPANLPAAYEVEL